MKMFDGDLQGLANFDIGKEQVETALCMCKPLSEC